MLSLRQHSDSDNQCYDTPIAGAQPKTHNTLLNKPMAPSQARTRCSASPDLMGRPIDWVQAYLAKKGEPQAGGHSSGPLVQEIAKKQVVDFGLPAALDNKAGWWNTPPCLSGLRQEDFIPECTFHGTRHIQEVRKEQTVVLTKAL